MFEPGHLGPERLAACLAALEQAPELRNGSFAHHLPSESAINRPLRRAGEDGEFASSSSTAADAVAAAVVVAAVSKPAAKADATSSRYFRTFLRWCVPMCLLLYILADKADVFRSDSFTELWCCTWFDQLSVKQGMPPAFLVGGGLGDSNALDLEAVVRRQLGADSASSAASQHSNHPHEAIFFLVAGLLLGTCVTHILTIPLLNGVQQTVVLYVLGVIVSLLLEWGKVADDLGVWGRSYVMWMGIDPHLLLFTMLPPLVTGDAMAIDTSIAKRVMKQCLFLAGPGVAIAGFATALFLWAYIGIFYDWDFLLCLTTGAILCATDPVAVVALLKELGASPTLTVQIQGESLINDGTAIVLYTVAYNMLSGKKYDVGDIITIVVKQAIYAWFLGTLIGYLFYKWIKYANNKLDHSSSVIQVCLTITCAYGSFVLAEGWLKISGVLSTVAAAGVLAHKMWPEVTHKETMLTFWHMLEYWFNSIIFFLAGALTGQIMNDVDLVDYLHLVVIYVVITLIRGLLLLCSRPLLTQLHQDKAKVSVPEVMVMTWGGLRGAIGLALGIQVVVGRADGNISVENANRVLFYVSGVAALTLTVNATTCPALVKWLGITQMPDTRKVMLLNIKEQLTAVVHSRTKDGNILTSINEALEEIEHHILYKDSRRERMSIAIHSLTRSPRKTMVAERSSSRSSHKASPVANLRATKRDSGNLAKQY